MSYIPTLVIKKSDLSHYENVIEKTWDYTAEDEKVLTYLRNVYKTYPVVKIDDLELLICQPEYASFNEMVRDQLDEWEVTYGISN